MISICQDFVGVIMAGKRTGKVQDLTEDYEMLGEMSTMLAQHQKKLEGLGKRIASMKMKNEMESGLIESLDIVHEHMKHAQAEIDKAKKRLKTI